MTALDLGEGDQLVCLVVISDRQVDCAVELAHVFDGLNYVLVFDSSGIRSQVGENGAEESPVTTQIRVHLLDRRPTHLRSCVVDRGRDVCTVTIALPLRVGLVGFTSFTSLAALPASLLACLCVGRRFFVVDIFGRVNIWNIIIGRWVV